MLVGTGGFSGASRCCRRCGDRILPCLIMAGERLCKEMVGGLVRQALSDPRVNRLVARTNEQNVRSRSVLGGERIPCYRRGI